MSELSNMSQSVVQRAHDAASKTLTNISLDAQSTAWEVVTANAAISVVLKYLLAEAEREENETHYGYEFTATVRSILAELELHET